MIFDMVLLGYYFLKSDFKYLYVWQFSSLDLPNGYKISAVLAGQPGTYLFWALVIFISALWLSETKKWDLPILRKSQIITLLIGLYFIILTLLDSPFKTIYEEEPTLPLGFVPLDGNGLNPLLINPWMAVHPPIMFLAYGVMTITFSLAIVYLLTGDKRWEGFARQWGRFTWLFLTLGIAIGGYWSYTVLGWGGFWAWDPVETSSLVPWFALTGFLHALSQHRKNQNKFSIAAPMLASLSFILVVYAALVTRSGLWESIHAFGSATTGGLLALLLAVSAIVSLILGILKYAKKEKYPKP
ncbi:MAG: cytochrome c biogenesis protein CcsA, partial [Methanosarcinales archaeon]